MTGIDIMTDLCPNLKLEPRPSLLGGKGLFLKTSYNKNDEILGIVPNSHILNRHNVQTYLVNHHNPLIKTVEINSLDDRLILLIFLLYHKASLNIINAANATSEESLFAKSLISSNPWSLYLSQLPSVVTVPTLFDPIRLKLLHGTVIPALVSSKLARLHNEYQFVLRLLVQDNPWIQVWTSVNDFQWCDVIYWSRVLDLPTSPSGDVCVHALVPVLDFANHSFEHPSIFWETDFNMNICIKSLLPSLNPISELYMCYDTDKSNEELLFTHGFTVPNNVRGCLSLDVKTYLSNVALEDEYMSNRLRYGIQYLHLRPIIHIRIQSVQSSVPQDQELLAFIGKCLCPLSVLLLVVIAVPDTVLESVIESESINNSDDLQPESVLDALLKHSDTQLIKERIIELARNACLFVNSQISLCPQDPILNTYCTLVKDITHLLSSKLVIT